MDNLKKMIKEQRKGEEEVSHPGYINNLVREMMQLGKLKHRYKTKMNVTLKTHNDLSKIIKEIKEIKKESSKSYR